MKPDLGGAQVTLASNSNKQINEKSVKTTINPYDSIQILYKEKISYVA